MRLPFPARVNLSHALIFATALGAVELLEGTNPLFAGCVFCFIMVAAVAFNIAGGFPYPSGAYIGFNAFFSLILPVIVKAILREPANTNLHTPMRTIEVYLLGMVSMTIAAIVSRKIRPKSAFISKMLPATAFKSAYIGCAVFSVIFGFMMVVVPSRGNGSLGSFLVQANRFPLLTLVLGVIYTVHTSKGKRSITWPLAAIIVYMSLGALLTFSKEQFLTPIFAWIVTAALLRYELDWTNVACLVVGLFVIVTYMVPYAQYGRGLQSSRPPTELAAYLLTHMDEVKAADDENLAVAFDIHYYNRRISVIDRLNIISGDDALIEVTDRDGPYGFRPIIEGFINIIPHVLYPDKPYSMTGNIYAHEIGLLGEEDDTTGISFSPSADSYHEGKMLGLLVVQPLVLMLIFTILDSVIGDVRRNPVGLLTTILVSRASLEWMLCTTPTLIGQYLFTNVLAAYVCAYVLPMLGSIFNKMVVQPQISTLLPGAPKLPGVPVPSNPGRSL